MPEDHPGSSPARRRALILFKLAVSVALLALLFSKIDAGRLWTTARRASLPLLVAALGATVAAGAAGHGAVPIWPTWLWAVFLIATALSAPVVLAPAGVGRLLQPLTVFHPEWVGGRIESVTAALSRFRDRPRTLAACFAGAIFVQAALVLFY